MMMNSYEYNGVQYHDEQIYSVENQIKDQLAKCETEGNSDDTRITELEKQSQNNLVEIGRINDELEAANKTISDLEATIVQKEERIAELEKASKPQQPQQETGA